MAPKLLVKTIKRSLRIRKRLILLTIILSYTLKYKNFDETPKMLGRLVKENIELVHDTFRASQKKDPVDIKNFKLSKLAEKISKELKVNVKIKEVGLEPINVNLPNPLNQINKVILLGKRKLKDRKYSTKENLVEEIKKNSEESNKDENDIISLADVVEEYSDKNKNEDLKDLKN